MTENKQENQPTVFGIRRIKDFAFLFNELLFEEARTNDIRVEFQHSSRFLGEKNLAECNLRAFFYYIESKAPENILLDITVQNLFDVPNLSSFKVGDKEYILPTNLIVSIVSLSITHTRALLSKNAAGTLYQNIFLPIVNPVEVAKSFFPNMFTEKPNKKVELLKANLESKKRKKKPSTT